MVAPPGRHETVDPFDLPEELGTADVVWRATDGLAGCLVRGVLEPADGDPLPCDLLAVDEACTGPVTDEATRRLVHRAWRDGQVHLGRTAGVDGAGGVAGPDQGRLTLLVPGTGFTADDVLETLARLARSLGAVPSSYAVLLRLDR
ncbi:hypothetical protein [Nocardioides plantarum]|uniref:Uncharacterized protein n=1 Tax=Nocardioides plantarum TaxID=29299 RepID=A0ABV5KD77_9ACTN|nr:hypothetical protein [Nocardioides plantarum]